MLCVRFQSASTLTLCRVQPQLKIRRSWSPRYPWSALYAMPTCIVVNLRTDCSASILYPLVVPSDGSIDHSACTFLRDARPFTPIIHFCLQSAEKAFACGTIR